MLKRSTLSLLSKEKISGVFLTTLPLNLFKFNFFLLIGQYIYVNHYQILTKQLAHKIDSKFPYYIVKIRLYKIRLNVNFSG
jgi:hypothetical protein